MIGPDLPAHLRNNSTTPDSDEQQEAGPSQSSPNIGPAIPPELLAHKTQPQPLDDEDDEDDYTPALPPDLNPTTRRDELARPSASSSSSGRKAVRGPALPPSLARGAYADDDDDDVGPMPLPSWYAMEEKDAVTEFMEKEERRRKQVEEAAKPKALKRDEWMLVPPSHSELLGSVDPTKLTKGRQFSKSAAPAREVDNSLWTETPAERQQRLADEVMGKRRRAVNAEPDEADDPEARKRRRHDEEVRRGVEEYTRKNRGGTLVNQHTAKSSSSKRDDDEDDGPPKLWDHSRDMALSGRLMDDKSRDKLIREARGLGDRFGTGKSGGFL